MATLGNATESSGKFVRRGGEKLGAAVSAAPALGALVLAAAAAESDDVS
jgi:hypothetical protein